mmetsp:Transcript_24303/g.43131  ORF Transcript_24303/g.43131 Transcript_24303/m.43131 type:complete len:234 (+) Transcript_24303:174-875(+)
MNASICVGGGALCRQFLFLVVNPVGNGRNLLVSLVHGTQMIVSLQLVQCQVTSQDVITKKSKHGCISPQRIFSLGTNTQERIMSLELLVECVEFDQLLGKLVLTVLGFFFVGSGKGHGDPLVTKSLIFVCHQILNVIFVRVTAVSIKDTGQVPGRSNVLWQDLTIVMMIVTMVITHCSCRHHDWNRPRWIFTTCLEAFLFCRPRIAYREELFGKGNVLTQQKEALDATTTTQA